MVVPQMPDGTGWQLWCPTAPVQLLLLLLLCCWCMAPLDVSSAAIEGAAEHVISFQQPIKHLSTVCSLLPPALAASALKFSYATDTSIICQAGSTSLSTMVVFFVSLSPSLQPMALTSELLKSV